MVIIDRIGKAAMYEQLAEECTELAQAALKAARFIRKENPTPLTKEEIAKSLIEEVSDVQNCLEELDLKPDREMMYAKITRFMERWFDDEDRNRQAD